MTDKPPVELIYTGGDPTMWPNRVTGAIEPPIYEVRCSSHLEKTDRFLVINIDKDPAAVAAIRAYAAATTNEAVRAALLKIVHKRSPSLFRQRGTYIRAQQFFEAEKPWPFGVRRDSGGDIVVDTNSKEPALQWKVVNESDWVVAWQDGTVEVFAHADFERRFLQA